MEPTAWSRVAGQPTAPVAVAVGRCRARHHYVVIFPKARQAGPGSEWVCAAWASQPPCREAVKAAAKSCGRMGPSRLHDRLGPFFRNCEISGFAEAYLDRRYGAHSGG